MSLSILKRGALVFGGAALLLSSTVGFTYAQEPTEHARASHSHRLKRVVRSELVVAATTLGLADAKALRKELAGSTLAAVAAKHNVAPSTLAAAMKADAEAKIDALVAAGKLKSERAAKLKARLAERIDKLMTREFKARTRKSA